MFKQARIRPAAADGAQETFAGPRKRAAAAAAAASMNQTACDAVGAGPSPLFTLGVVGAALLGAVALAFLILGLIATVWGRATARRLVADLQSRYAPLRRAPRELYLVYLMKLLESYGYFSFSLIMVLFLSDEFGQTDAQAGWVYGLFGMMITLYGLCVGVLIDNFGVRKSLILGSVLLLISRFSAMLTTSMGLMYVNLFLLMPLGTALGIPVLATAIRRYTTADSRAVAFGLFYAAMNVAALLSGPAADLLRGAFACGTRIGGVHLSAHRLLLLSSVVTTAAMLAIAILGVREIEIVDSGGGGGEPTSSGGGGGSASSGSGCGAHAIAAFTPRRGSPWGIAKEIGRTSRFWRFLLLVVLLVAVRLIFRHLDATLPKYLLRSHGPSVPYGLIYAINPALIIVLVPLVSAYTRHVPPLEMIKWGSLVAAGGPGGSLPHGGPGGLPRGGGLALLPRALLQPPRRRRLRRRTLYRGSLLLPAILRVCDHGGTQRARGHLHGPLLGTAFRGQAPRRRHVRGAPRGLLPRGALRGWPNPLADHRAGHRHLPRDALCLLVGDHGRPPGALRRRGRGRGWGRAAGRGGGPGRAHVQAGERGRPGGRLLAIHLCLSRMNLYIYSRGAAWGISKYPVSTSRSDSALRLEHNPRARLTVTKEQSL